MFHQAVADRLGLNVTGHKCLESVNRLEQITPGDLARHTGLTTGAVTGVVDRLERTGYVVRERSTADRRQVLLRGRPDAAQRVYQVLEPVAHSIAEVTSRYSEKELAVIHRYLAGTIEDLRRETDRLRGTME